MSVERPLQVSLYWGGQIQYDGDFICYMPRTSNRTFILRHRVGYDELVDRIYQYVGVDKGMFKLKLFLRHPCGRSNYIVSSLLNDESLDVMYDLWNGRESYVAEIYIEQEQIVQVPVVNSVFIGPTGNVGPMMSLVHAMDGSRFFGVSSTVVPETSSSQYMINDRCMDSIDFTFASGPRGDVEYFSGLDSIQSFADPGPSHLMPSSDHMPSHGIESNIRQIGPRGDQYASGHDRLLDSEGEDDLEIDAEEVEDSESQDVLSSDSDDEHEETQQQFVDEGVTNTYCGDNARHNNHSGSAYVPRGLAFFSDVRSIDDDDFSDEDGLERIVTFSEENNNIRLHMRFESKQQLSRAIRLWSINRNREFRVIESKSNTWVAKCKSSIQGCTSTANSSAYQSCDWCVRAIKKKTHGMWQITRWVNDHNCLGDLVRNSNTSLTASVIFRHITRSIEDDPGLKVKNIISLVKENLKVDVSYKKAWHARCKAIELVYGSWDANFAELPSYLNAVVQSNLGIVVTWLHHPGNSDRVKTFQFVFWAFGPAIDAFHMCRPIICIDGTHLRGEYKGKLLVAVTQDANNYILPIAYAIVDEETISSWSWFMEQLRYHVAHDRYPICIISDRHNGIIHTMTEFDYWKELLAFHRFCLRHVRSNLMTRFKGLHLKRLCWAMEKARQMRKWQVFRRELRSVFPDAWTYLSSIGLEKWCLTRDGGHRWGVLTTNISESYNNVLRGARHLPIRACIDMTFHRTVELFQMRREAATHCRNHVPPKICRRFKNADKKAGVHRVVEFDGSSGVYKVVSGRRIDGKGGNTQTVKYNDKTYSCGKWQHYRLPCSHVMAVCRNRGDDPGLLVDSQFTKRRWAVQYSGKFNPMPHQDNWRQPDWELQADRSKFIARRAGRVRARRIRNEMDERDADEPRRCRNCHQPGHNRRN